MKTKDVQPNRVELSEILRDGSTISILNSKLDSCTYYSLFIYDLRSTSAKSIVQMSAMYDTSFGGSLILKGRIRNENNLDLSSQSMRLTKENLLDCNVELFLNAFTNNVMDKSSGKYITRNPDIWLDYYDKYSEIIKRFIA